MRRVQLPEEVLLDEEARLLSRLDHRQHGAAHRGRPAALDARDHGRGRGREPAAADRNGSGEGTGKVLEAAYDDARGVTAAFNMNLVTRINRELGGTIPDNALEHEAIWNDDLARIEMHLRATRDIAFEVSGERFLDA